MTITTRVALLAAGAVAMAAFLAPGAHTSAKAEVAPITDFSSAQDGKKKAAPKAGAPQRAAPSGGAPKMMAPKMMAPKVGAPKAGDAKIKAPKVGAPKAGAPKVGAPKTVAPKVVAPKAAARVFTPKGADAGKVIARKLGGLPKSGAGQAFIHGKKYSAWRSGYRVRYDSGWRTFVGLSTLAAILVGTNYFYPYAYIATPVNYCVGLTADGCQLVWDEVLTIEGDLIGQCVAYCPWQ